MSSRLKPNVICVRSFVPKLKKSACSAISSAVSAARGTSIIVPIEDVELAFELLLGLDRRRSSARVMLAQHLQLRGGADERNHDLGLGVDLLALAGDRRFDDRPYLHLEDFGIGDAKRQPRWPSIGLARATARRGASRPPASRPVRLAISFLGLVVVRQEFVQRRIEQANRDRQALHRGEDADEVFALERQQLGQAPSCDLRPLSARIISRIGEMRSPSKNMCSVRHRPMPSAPNSRARLASAGVSALVRIFSVRYLSAHFMTVPKSPLSFGFLRGDRAFEHFAGRAVERDGVLRGERLAVDRDLFALLIDVQGTGTDDAATAPTASDHRRVAGHRRCW